MATVTPVSFLIISTLFGTQKLLLLHSSRCLSHRYGGAELHTIGAFVGGVAAQEVIKIVTHQYVPFSNTYIYNGITGRALTIRV